MKKVDYMLDPSEIHSVEKEHSEIPWGLVLLAVIGLMVGMIFERMVIDPFISTVHASEDVSDLPDKMQEKYFCRQVLFNNLTVEKYEKAHLVPLYKTDEEIKKHCEKYN